MADRGGFELVSKRTETHVVISYTGDVGRKNCGAVELEVGST